MSMQVYCLDGGRIEMDLSVFRPSMPRGSRVVIPVPMFLVLHPKGNVLIDTGCNPAVVGNPAAWGGLARAMVPQLGRENVADMVLERVGLSPRDVDIVINTHLHMDHAGGNQFFPHAEILVQEREWAFARAPEQEGHGYFRADWDHPLRYRILSNVVHDVFGDMRIVVRRTAGHTPGHQIVELLLSDRGKVILTGDVVPLAANLDGEVPRNNLDGNETMAAAQYLRNQAAQGAFLIFGHDPEGWDQLPKPPACLS